VTQLLDQAHQSGRLRLPYWIDQGDAEDARDVLSATAGAIITTLGLVLSITVLTLSIAASQFGQRMLRRYMRDRGTQVSIGIFAATFVFSLLTLLSITSGAERPEYVPWLSVWLSTMLAVACIGVLIFFVHHVAETIQVNNVVAEIARDLRRRLQARAAIESEEPEPDPQDIFQMPARPDFHLRARQAGYLQSIDYQRLAHAAAQEEVRIQFLKRPGQFVLEGAEMAAVARDRPRDRLDGTADRLAEVSDQAIQIGTVRMLRQDPSFAFDQLVEVALRAMSPGASDPHTLYACVDWLAEGLRLIATARPARCFYASSDGEPRVQAEVPTFDLLVRRAFDPLREVIRDSARASTHLLVTLEALAPHLQPEQALALQQQAELIHSGLVPDMSDFDRAAVRVAYQHAVRALADRVPAAVKPLSRITG
jgi:uncharacterized membrane protein